MQLTLLMQALLQHSSGKNINELPLEYVSENVEELSGYSVKELLSGKITILGIVHPEDLERVNNELIDFSKEKNKTTFTHKPYRILKKTGILFGLTKD